MTKSCYESSLKAGLGRFLKKKAARFSERLYTRERESVPLRSCFNAHQWARPGLDTNCAKL